MSTAGLRFTSSSTNTKPNNNMINSIMNFLPDNRPVTSILIVEDYEK